MARWQSTRLATIFVSGARAVQRAQGGVTTTKNLWTPASPSERCVTPRPSAPVKAIRFDDAINHSDAGSHYTAIYYSETPILEGLIPSMGDHRGLPALDDALCETTIGPYKTACVRGCPVSRRADRNPHRPGRHHRRTGSVVQRQPAHAPAWPSSARGSGDRVLRTDLTPECTPVTQNEACMKPGIFMTRLVRAGRSS